MQLTQQKAKTVQKTLESLLLTRDPVTGEQVSISSRCAELDAEIPRHLGVSKAILDNVIFCHQEESNWPLSEPGLLKKKFDDIFSSAKYAKALEAIKKLRKQRVQEIKLDEQKHEYLKADRDKAFKIRKNIRAATQRITESKEKIYVIDRDLEKLTGNIELLESDWQEYEKIHNLINQLENQKTMFERNISDLQMSMTLMNESDEELEKLQSNQNAKNSEIALSLETLNSEKGELVKRLSDLEGGRYDLLKDHGRISATLEAHAEMENQIWCELKKAMSSIGKEVKENSFSHSIFVNSLKEFSIHVEKLLTEYESFKNSSQSQLSAAQADVTNARNHKIKMEEKRGNMMEMLDSNEKKIVDLNRKLESYSNTELKIQDLNSQIALNEQNLKDLQESIEKQNFDALIQEKQAFCTDMEKEISQIQDSMFKSASSMKEKLRIEELVEAVGNLKSQIDAESEELTIAWKQYSETDEYETKMVTSRIENIEEKLRRNKDKHESSMKLKIEIESAIQLIKTSKQNKEDERQLSIEIILKHCELEEVESKLLALETEYEENRNILSSSENAVSMYSRFKTAASENHACPLCVRSFVSDLERENFVSRMDNVIEKIPERIADASSRKPELEGEIAKLKSLLPYVTQIKTLDDQIKSAVLEIKSLELKLKSIQSDVSNDDAELGQELDKLKSFLMDYSNIQEIKNSLMEKEKLLRSLQVQFTGVSDQPMEEMQVRANELKIEIEKVKSDLNSLFQGKKQMLSDIETLRIHQTDLNNTKNSLERQANDMTLTQSSLTEVQKSRDEFKSHIESMDKEIEVLSEILENALDAEKKIKESAEIENHALLSQINEQKISLERLNTFSKNAEKRNDLEVQFANVSRNLEHHESVILIEKEKLSQTQKSIGDFSRESSEITVHHRNVNDNLTLRKLQSEVKALLKTISENRDIVKGFNVEEKKEQLKEDKKQFTLLLEKKAEIMGEAKQVEEAVSGLKNDLQTDYEDIENNYRQQYLKVYGSQLGNRDLEIYAKAMDSAIMKYHTLKMDEINKIIRELWVNTYQGSDIDTIEIRSDNVGAKGGSSYNYRIVMIKGDSELDMRGRCSAGQRVLTSLIVRLALAESFGVNCGILALDEPTTNLDRENIESLAESLSNIINSRKKQNNFQLIIITHDEEFVKMLGRSEHCDYFWRVDKNDGQNSTISRQSII